jgi:methionyl aminopeptidase
MITRKNLSDLDKMREAGLIVARTLRTLRQMVEPGITTKELNAFAESNIRAAGAVPTFLGYRGFNGSICTSINDEVVHGIPSQRRLKDGDILKIDCGATFQGFVGDAAISVLVGKVAPEVEKLMEVTRESLLRAIEIMVAGNRLFDVSHAVQKLIEAQGYTLVREFCGHGVGTLMHEAPQVPNYGRPGTGPRLKAGWVLAIEPMVNIGRREVEMSEDGWTVTTRDRKPSAHFEHTVAVTEDGPQVMTAFEDGSVIL